MKRTHQDLWDRIRAFPLDKEGARLQFSAKLARENGWSREYALRAIEEYRRFVYLAVVADHPVSPSDQVDQVWHLHLMYTQEYWHDFCRETLGKPLHHGPSKGGRKESAKFENWYTRTLASYREHFKEEPPADIWPDHRLRYSKAELFQRVNTHEHWIIRKPNVRRESVAILALGLLAVGCTTSNPFDFSGPEFLGFYGFLLLICTGLAIWVRQGLLGPRFGAQPPSLDPISIAYLNGGKVLAVNAALTLLESRGNIELTLRAPVQVLPKSNDFQGLSAFEVAVMKAIGPDGCLLKDLRASLEPQLEGIRATLLNMGLLLPSDRAAMAVAVPMLITFAPVVAGAIKIFIGLNRDRPVLFLILFCVGTLILGVSLFAKAPVRSRFGTAHLQELRHEASEWKYRSASSHEMPANALMMGVALYGLGALADSSHSDFKRSVQPGHGSTSCGGGTGCGGSSDSGGSGDGGGCGSGCGGCGGGGD